MKHLPILTAIGGFLVGAAVILFYNSLDFSTHVKKSIYDECFQYYAEAEREDGISKESIGTCWKKANDWLGQIEK